MKLLAIVLSALGTVVMLSSFGYDTAPEGTHNIGLLQGQIMLFESGGLLIIVGALFSAMSIVLARLEAAGILPPPGFNASTSTSDSRE